MCADSNTCLVRICPKLSLRTFEIAVGTLKLKVYKRHDTRILFYKTCHGLFPANEVYGNIQNGRKSQVDNIIAAVFCKTLKTDFWVFRKLWVDF